MATFVGPLRGLVVVPRSATPSCRNLGRRVIGQICCQATIRLMPHPLPESDRLLSIGVIAQRTGLRVSAIRYYESVGLLEPPRRISGRRVYDRSVFELIAQVRFAKEAGFTIAEIRELVSGFESATPASERLQALARRKLADVVDRIERAQRMKALLERLLRCHCETLGQCVQPTRRQDLRRRELSRQRASDATRSSGATDSVRSDAGRHRRAGWRVDRIGSPGAPEGVPPV